MTASGSFERLPVHSAITRKNLLSALLLLHLLAITLSSGMAIVADCDGDRLRPLFLSFMITGWITVLLAVVFLVRSLLIGHTQKREIVLLIILVLIGLDESRMATQGWMILSAIRG